VSEGGQKILSLDSFSPLEMSANVLLAVACLAITAAGIVPSST
jgi:hypothetical protein